MYHRCCSVVNLFLDPIAYLAIDIEFIHIITVLKWVRDALVCNSEVELLILQISFDLAVQWLTSRVDDRMSFESVALGG